MSEKPWDSIKKTPRFRGGEFVIGGPSACSIGARVSLCGHIGNLVGITIKHPDCSITSDRSTTIDASTARQLSEFFAELADDLAIG